MKSLFIFLILLCSAAIQAQDLKISGQVVMPNSDYFILREPNNKLVDSMHLNASNQFEGRFSLSSGYYELFDGKEYKTIYLEPGFDLKITLDAGKFDETFQFEGNGAGENNYLSQKYLLTEGLGQANYYVYYFKLEESRFLQLRDSVKQLYLDLIETFTFQSPVFNELERMDIELEWKIKLASYPKSHIFFTRDSSYLISEQFPDIWSDIELDREDLLVLPAYIEFLDKYVSRTADSIKDALDSFDYFMARIRAIEMELLNLKVREACLQYLGKHYFLRARDIDWMYANMMRLSTDNEFKEDLKSWYDAKKRMESGMPSPDFVLYDKDSNLVKLSDFRGQYVYIDIWATWCGPCIREIPDFKVLQAEFDSANIVFISIAFNDYYERWLSMIESEGLAGLHLFAPNTKEEFFQIYMVSGIPRYILIDPQGNIVDADAKRPSNKNLSPELKELLGISQ